MQLTIDFIRLFFLSLYFIGPVLLIFIFIVFLLGQIVGRMESWNMFDADSLIISSVSLACRISFGLELVLVGVEFISLRCRLYNISWIAVTFLFASSNFNSFCFLLSLSCSVLKCVIISSLCFYFIIHLYILSYRSQLNLF